MRIGIVFIVSVVLVGCDDSNVDRVTNGGGCTADPTPGGRGQCPGGQIACVLGAFDRDGLPGNGCEGLLEASADYSLFALEPGGLTLMALDGHPVDAGVSGGWIAFSGPSCTATITTPCNYQLLAAQIALGGFQYDGVRWSDGILALPTPLPVVDDGGGLFVPAGSNFVASFLVGGVKHAVSSGATQSGATVATHGTDLIVTVGDARFSFGGYTIENMMIVAEGRRAVPGP